MCVSDPSANARRSLSGFNSEASILGLLSLYLDINNLENEVTNG